MTPTTLAALIGRTGTITHEDRLSYRVRIRDAKSSYGHDRVRIEPVDGSGSAWVNLDRVRMGEEG